MQSIHRDQALQALSDLIDQHLPDPTVGGDQLEVLRRYLEQKPAPALREHGFVKPDTDQQVFFYEQDFYVLSNFSAFAIYWYGDRFDTSEAVYHWHKFPDPTPQHTALRQQIKDAPSAHVAYKIAEQNKGLRCPDWDDVKVSVMREILRAKVEQHEYVRRKLLATGERELIEDSWRDDFWGWGPNRDGQNQLGRIWMEIRAELRVQGEAAQSTPGAE